MPDSNSSTRVFFRLQNELLEALDELVDELRAESMGQVTDRSKAARYLLAEAIRGRRRDAERRGGIDEALRALSDDDAPRSEAATG